MNVKIKHIILALCSLIVVFVTLFIPVRLENVKELQAARLGYPAYFLEQDFSAKYGNAYFFPTWEKIDWSGKSPIVNISWAKMAVDFLLVFAICEVFFYILETLDFAIRKEK